MKIFISSIIFSFVSIFGLAQTNVSGGIYQNTTWSLSGSPYIVNSSIVVFPGNTLTIEPGVEIQINNQNDINIYIETRGTINCIGTDAQPIKIYALYDTTNVGWQGFICTSSQGGVLNADRFEISNAFTPFAYEAPLNVYNYTNSKFIRCHQAVTLGNTVNLNNCVFYGNQTAVYGWSYFNITNCYFEQNNTAVYAYATAFTMSDSQFIGNGSGVSFASGVFDSMQINNCVFESNLVAINFPNNGKITECEFSDNETGIQAAYGCEIYFCQFTNNNLALDASVLADIHDNQINQNLGGITISNVTSASNSPSIYNNEICGNLNFNVNNNTNMNYSLFSNCFCELDSAQIEAFLIDGYDDITKGLINYQIYDSSCTVLLGNVVKFGAGAGLDESQLVFRFENPVGQNLELFSEQQVEQIVIQHLSGQQYTFKSNTANSFDVSCLPAGFYFLYSADGVLVRQAFMKY
jgi:hypothetical protein